MAKNYENGQKGEVLAAEFLLKNGYFIVAKNWRWRKLEIDLIAEIEGFIVFVEVKTRLINGVLPPEEAMTRQKKLRIIKASNAFVKKYEINAECRFDVIAVRLGERHFKLHHYRNAFYPRPTDRRIARGFG